MTDYYDVLGLSRQAEGDAVAKAFRRYAMAYHPQCQRGDGVNTHALQHRFRRVCQAYTVLSNPTVRAVYDLYGEEGVRHGAATAAAAAAQHNNSNNAAAAAAAATGTVACVGVDIDAIDPDAVFRAFFGVDSPFRMVGGIDGVHGNQHDYFSALAQQPRVLPTTAPLVVQLPMTLEDVYYGAVRRVTWRSAHTHAAQGNNSSSSNNSNNKSSSGSGDSYDVTYTDESAEVHIERGADSDDYFVLPGRGNSAPGCARGDVVVRLQLQPHERFRREGDDLVVRVPVTLTEALCGTTVTVQTMDRRALAVLIDEIVHPQYRNRIAGEGLPRKTSSTRAATAATAATTSSSSSAAAARSSATRGDLVIECATRFPSFLTLEQKSELRRILDAK